MLSVQLDQLSEVAELRRNSASKLIILKVPGIIGDDNYCHETRRTK